jgi:arginine decarboxylase
MTFSGLADALATYAANEAASFHMPGHKQRPPSAEAEAALGVEIWRHDVSEMGGFDYLHAPTGAIGEAQRAAAATFGAGRTFFLVGGSTIGNLAAFVAHAHDGEDVAVIRGSHRSVYAGIVLSGAQPRYIAMAHDDEHDGWFLPQTPKVAGFPSKLAIVHVTRPNYYGMAVDLAPFRALADATGAVLIVDEAHGSHFGMHAAFPTSALQEGADVVIQSTHKTLRSLTQASMLHVRHGFDASLIERALPMLQSSSPSALLSVSLDLARSELDMRADQLFSALLGLAATARAAVAQLDGFHLMETTAKTDPAKLVIDVSHRGWSGFAASQWLRDNHRVWIELADFKRIVCSLTFGDTNDSVEQLITALQVLHAATPPRKTNSKLTSLPIPSQALAPRDALRQDNVALSLDDAVDRICAEYVIPYPPGIPLVVPGEVLSAEVLRTLKEFTSAGSKIVGPADPAGAVLRVTE